MPGCEGKDCGDDGCGASCGACDAGSTCDAGLCVPDCVPGCEGKDCGDDGCGASCGACDAGSTCDAGLCVPDCVPDCEGRECGWDGCSAVCGYCGSGEDCVSAKGLCGKVGDNCETPIMAASAPFDVTVDTADLNNDFGFAAEVCPELDAIVGASAPDAVVRFEPPVSATYTITKASDHEAALFIVTDCSDLAASCLQALSPSNEEAHVSLQEGSMVYVIVDGWGANSGPVEISISAPCFSNACDGAECGTDECGASCGTCAPGGTCEDGTCLPDASLGDTCDAPIPILELPFEHIGDTSENTDDYNATGCEGSTAGTGAGDAVFAFTPPQTAIYTLGLEPQPSAPMPATVYVTTGCDDIATGCVAVSGDLWGGATTLVTLEAGVPYLLIVDGLYASDSGPYLFSVSPPCLPGCAGKECGSDGCGGSCGVCGAGEACGAEHACVDASLLGGNTCENPFFIDEAPIQIEGDTSTATPAVSIPEDACPGVSSAKGLASSDHIYAFMAPMTATYDIVLSPTFDAALYVAAVCEDTSGSCLAAADGLSDEQVTLTLAADEVVFIVVDGFSQYNDLSGPYTLSIGAPCLSSCADKDCGDDGCGGNCGVCSDGTVCDPDGQCVDTGLLEGNTCALPFSVTTAPAEFEGDTNFASPDSSFEAESCSGAPGAHGLASADHVYAFTAPAAGSYDIVVEAEFDTVLYVASDCADVTGSCLAASDSLSVEEVTVTLGADETVFVFVDGYSQTQNLKGLYSLSISAPCVPSCNDKVCGPDGCGASCGVCPEELACDLEGQCVPGALITGNTCDEPIVVETVPAEVTGDTSFATPNFSFEGGECPGVGGSRGHASNDHVYSFKAEAAGVYPVILEASFDSTLYVVGDCEDVGGSCIAASDLGPIESLYIPMEVGARIFIIVDGWSTTLALEGAYTLSIGEPCIPECAAGSCGDDGCGGACACSNPDEVCQAATLTCGPPVDGDTCAVAQTLPVEVEVTVDNLAGFTNVYDASACAGGGSAGSTQPDVVFTLVPAGDGVHRFDLVGYTSGSGPSLVSVWSACPTGAGACVGYADFYGDPQSGLEVSLSSGEEYFVVVDSFGSGENGTVQLLVTPPCLPECPAGYCGDDGCGGACSCAAGKVCLGGACQQEGNGEACGGPLVIDQLPFSASGETLTAQSDVWLASGQCSTQGEAGAAAADVVYAFSPAASGSYEIHVTMEYSGFAYLVTECGTEATGCIAVGSSYGGLSILDANLTAGEVYYLVIDGDTALPDHAGPYAIYVPKPRGDTCDLPLYLSAGSTLTSDTLWATPDYFALGCEGLADGVGAGSSDAVYVLFVDTPATYTFTFEADFDAALYVSSSCGSCVAGVEASAEGAAGSLTLSLGEETTVYYLTIDGQLEPTDEGNFTLTISDPCLPNCGGKSCGSDGCSGDCGACGPGLVCDGGACVSDEPCDPVCGAGQVCWEGACCTPACDGESCGPGAAGCGVECVCGAYDACIDGVCSAVGPGATCTDPVHVGELPWSDAGDTLFASVATSHPDGGCGASANGVYHPDVVYRFDPSATGQYEVHVSTEFPAFVSLYDGCPELGGDCLAASDNFGGFHIVEGQLVAGGHYYLVVDGNDAYAAGAGPYSVLFKKPRGDTCDPSFFVNPDQTVFDTTAWATHDYVAPPSCLDGATGTAGGATRDLVYALFTDQPATYTITVSPEFDAAVYVMQGCPGVCIGGTDAGGDGDVESFEISLGPESVYFIVVDGHGPDDFGPFALTVSKPCVGCDD